MLRVFDGCDERLTLHKAIVSTHTSMTNFNSVLVLHDWQGRHDIIITKAYWSLWPNLSLGPLQRAVLSAVSRIPNPESLVLVTGTVATSRFKLQRKHFCHCELRGRPKIWCQRPMAFQLRFLVDVPLKNSFSSAQNSFAMEGAMVYTKQYNDLVVCQQPNYNV